MKISNVTSKDLSIALESVNKKFDNKEQGLRLLLKC